jgi:anion-transporting  ArsA/GET3 family ATPase
LLDSQSYDLIILDTPPAQHAVDFLEAPEKISSLFQEQVVRWFLGEGGGFLQKVIHRGTKLVLDLFGKMTGSSFMSELNNFFVSVKELQESIAKKSLASAALLRAESTQFLLVTGFDHGKLQEADELKDYLSRRSHRLAGVIVNRGHPGWQRPKEIELNEIYENWNAYYESRGRIYDTYAKKWQLSLPVWRIPDFNSDISGIESLKVVADVFETKN